MHLPRLLKAVDLYRSYGQVSTKEQSVVDTILHIGQTYNFSQEMASSRNLEKALSLILQKLEPLESFLLKLKEADDKVEESIDAEDDMKEKWEAKGLSWRAKRVDGVTFSMIMGQLLE